MGAALPGAELSGALGVSEVLAEGAEEVDVEEREVGALGLQLSVAGGCSPRLDSDGFVPTSIKMSQFAT